MVPTGQWTDSLGDSRQPIRPPTPGIGQSSHRRGRKATSPRDFFRRLGVVESCGPASSFLFLFCVGLSTFLLLPRIVIAQTLQGELLDRGTGAPVEGALVTLLDEVGQEVDGYLTNQAGRFLLRAQESGRFTVRAERIGFETVTSDPLLLEVGQVSGLRLETVQVAIELEGLRVQAEQQCVVRPQEGLELAGLWEEARKALRVQEWTEREGLFRFEIVRYERQLDRDGRQGGIRNPGSRHCG